MVSLQVKGMSCNHCVMSVTKAVKALDPAAEVRVDLAQGRVDVDTKAPANAVSAAIADAGYEVAGAAS